MKEEHVSLEIAKLLKEKGFDYDVFAAHTFYVVCKWLRETMEIHVMIDVCASGYYAVLWKTNGTFIKTLADKGPNDGGVWDIYDDALHVGILEALKFI